MKKVRKTCAFTGHRPKKLPWGYNETDVRCVALKVALERQIRSLVQEGVMDFLSGMAEGVDLLAAEIVLHLRSEYPRSGPLRPRPVITPFWRRRIPLFMSAGSSEKIVCWSAITFWPLILMSSITVSIGAAQRRPYATRRNWDTA